MTIVESKYLSRDAFAARIAKCPVAILPLGATEQHGYHMPLGTDTILAEFFSRRIAEATGATVLPAMPFGYSWVWRDAPGTVTLDQKVMEDVICNVAESLVPAGVKHLILVNGHEANSATMKYATRRMWDHPDIDVWRLFYPNLAEELKQHCESPTWHGIVHACEFETSLMLAIAPETVEMDKAVAEYPERDAGYFHGGRPMGELSRSGVFGDATKGTAEKGHAMVETFTTRMVDMVREICA
ncbi:creatininase family protein [Pseudooceanicola aestuarii]|uniref:creatininase family protein n=1 Tax=Pseudooceanicola aestuarii TaxID=2697319 RepID=UPI0013CF8F30|nr:creatininase family protein [Pseudooceanicola aestuarii]